MVDIASVLGDARWLAHRFEPVRDTVHFRRLSRADHASATFITDEYLGRETHPVIIDRERAVAGGAKPGPLHFIFHSAFCLSTLLARAFDLPGRSMALKEPVALNDVVGWRHRETVAGPRVVRALDGLLQLLARPFACAEATIIKPSNVANGLADVMLALRPDAHALLLHAPLPTFLRSIAKKGLDGRLWVRDLLAKQLRDGLIDLGFEGEDYLRLTDLQVAAVGWLAQEALFARLAAKYSERVRTLDSETLLARPEAAIAAIAMLFGMALTDTEIADVIAGPAFTGHSKTGAAYGSDERAADYQAAAAAHGDEIDKVIIWAEAVARNAGLSAKPPMPLLP